MTANTSVHKGRDPRYLTAGADGGHVGGTRYYTEAAGERPGRWAGRAPATLGLAGDVDPDQMQALYMDRVGPDGVRLDARAQARFRPVKEREDLAVAAHLAVHPLASEGELAQVRAAERGKSRHATPYFDFTVSAAKSVSVLHASLLVAARRAREARAHDRALDLEARASEITDALVAPARAGVARIERALFVRTATTRPPRGSTGTRPGHGDDAPSAHLPRGRPAATRAYGGDEPRPAPGQRGRQMADAALLDAVPGTAGRRRARRPGNGHPAH